MDLEYAVAPDSSRERALAISDDAHSIKQRWLVQALQRAGIQRGRWDPNAGVAVNRRIIEHVYGYYGGLYLAHEFLKWAGMACLVGPAFYAGFRDLGLLPDAIRRGVLLLFGRLSRKMIKWATGDLGFYEVTFLTMQKKIFEDQGVMHEAYLAGGLTAIEQLRAASIIDDATCEAWRRIDVGRRNNDPRSMDEGNRMLLFREQYDIIDRFYLQMLRHPLDGRAFTYLITLAGAPSVPGAKSFAEIFPLTLDLRLPWPEKPTLFVGTPLASGNIAIFANRWGLIEEDTFPAYLRFIDGNEQKARALVSVPIASRVARFRLSARACYLLASAFTRWTVHLVRGRTPAEGRRLPRQIPSIAAKTLGATIDLTHKPDRVSAGLESHSDNRIWGSGDREPFEVTVALAGGRVYRTPATLAVLFASRIGGDPDRLTVRLPSTSLHQTDELLRRYATEWNFPADAVESWRARAESRALREGEYQDRTYSTHVFTAKALDFVALQFQVAHHILENEFTVSALFGWDAEGINS